MRRTRELARCRPSCASDSGTSRRARAARMGLEPVGCRPATAAPRSRSRPDDAPARFRHLDRSLLGAALLVDGELRLRLEYTERSHAELLLPMIDGLLAEAGLGARRPRRPRLRVRTGCLHRPADLGGVAQGLAFAAGLPVAPVSSLAAVAELVPAAAGESRAVVQRRARMGEVYWVSSAARPTGPLPRSARSRSPRRAGGRGGTRAVHAAGNALRGISAAGRPARGTRADAACGAGIHARMPWRAWAPGGLRAGAGVSAELALPVYVRDDVARPSAAPSR